MPWTMLVCRWWAFDSIGEVTGNTRGEILYGGECRSREVILVGKPDVAVSSGGSEPNREKVGVDESFKVALQASKSIKLSLDLS